MKQSEVSSEIYEGDGCLNGSRAFLSWGRCNEE